MIRLFYHLWADGKWEQPTTEWLEAVEDSGLADVATGSYTIGIIGGTQRRRAVLRWLEAIGLKISTVQYPHGYEQHTLEQVWLHSQWAAESSEPAYVWYGHSKGAADPSPINHAWRRSMLFHTVARWNECLYELRTGADLVGCHWLTREEFHEGAHNVIGGPFFGGNFWWARADYLRNLPEPDALSDARYDAETWVGSGRPRRVVDMLPGWPGFKLFEKGQQGEQRRVWAHDPGECFADEHDWERIEEGTALTRGLGMRYCVRCDREEWDNGVVRPGYRLREVAR